MLCRQPFKCIKCQFVKQLALEYLVTQKPAEKSHTSPSKPVKVKKKKFYIVQQPLLAD